MADAFSLENEVFRSFLACGSTVIIKMLCLAPMTSFQRIKYKAFANPEDIRRLGPAYAVRLSDKVERVKSYLSDMISLYVPCRNLRCHLNDVENIPAFLALGAMYLATKPSPIVAMWHFRIFAISRVCHTIIYMIGVQPYRAISFLFGLGVNISMATQILLATFKFTG
ncbi:microsomal glutathione S-transferase 1-like isoform X1 [Ptychodera flava]|uniref:microsomal glutathione S-transferase 1-like isoform X1 n=1 Tax=Ptychodera flava TaxID=63121 RepID=UPI00396A23C8